MTSKPGTSAVLTPGEVKAGGPFEPIHELKISLGSTVKFKFPLSDQNKVKQKSAKITGEIKK